MPPCKVHVPKAKPPHGLVVLGTSALHMRNRQSVGFHRGLHPVREAVRPRSLQSIGTWLLDFSRWLEGGGTTAVPGPPENGHPVHFLLICIFARTSFVTALLAGAKMSEIPERPLSHRPLHVEV